MRGDVPHLHVSSGFSARYGASHPRDLIAWAAERGIGTVALTDRDMVTGTVRFAKAAAAAGVKPVFGVDLGVAPHVPPAEVRRRTPCAAVRTWRKHRSGRRSWSGTRRVGRGCAGWCPPRTPKPFPRAVPPHGVVGDARRVRRRRPDGVARPGVGASAGPRRRSCGRRRAAPRALAAGRRWRAAAGGRVLGPVRHRPRVGPSRRAHHGARRPPRHSGGADERRSVRGCGPAPGRGRAGRCPAAAARRPACGWTAGSAGSRTGPR